MTALLDFPDKCLACGEPMTEADGEDEEICAKCWQDFHNMEHEDADTMPNGPEDDPREWR